MIKKLQYNFTTLEQSKRLLELGVPADSADCYLNGNSIIMLNGKTFQENYNEDLDLARLHLMEYPHYLPCWSVGRLMEIYGICMGVEGFFYCKGKFITEAIRRIEWSVKNKTIDFSKLEK